jgi:very-short-patch-repair endonuclease
MDFHFIRKAEYTCNRCKKIYKISNISSSVIEKNFDKLTTLCNNCRLYRICENPNCSVEFHHHQNRTCSKECSEELKKQTYIKSTGKPHNFCKGSSSRLKFENEIKEKYGVINQFQIEETKKKIRSTWINKYGQDNPSKVKEIKQRKKLTLSKTIENNPNHYKEVWKRTNQYFIDTLGYDPRLSKLSLTSKESLLFFEDLINFLNDNKIKYYVGIENNREFCIRDKQNNRSYFYDLVIPSNSLIIEYHGTAWHAKENQFDFVHPISKQSYEDNRKYQQRKNEVASNLGYKVIEIWSDEPDKEDKLKNIIKQIKNENQENSKG